MTASDIALLGVGFMLGAVCAVWAMILYLDKDWWC